MAVLLTAVLVVYLWLLADRAFILMGSGDPVAIVLGGSILVLPVLGLWMVIATWRFGVRTAALGEQLAEEGGLPDSSDLPRMASGRVEREAADAWFEEWRSEVEQRPKDWRAWFRLAHAYDVAGDRRRAREAMRRAVDLAN
ncbi:hypothetical protein [Actinoalloteichus hymeniacidonis]|uniref:Tetratricopeptide repeat protein n=1 Tax=Actinoalloteichus hymeniacidonis TaxID=340345 RepID=A0AAC9HPK2_9PSEU|nr:hypothetical protein [Actinoalloteichus hymeniacidonis]AOS62676.1 hypothetical protein TL08_09305 [Actinoalloteichus hymeniacidonis]MBB5909293.1 hypothetical protein [Actinoalloteichus hymeniacidonis]